jgi:hypothetical protein
MALLVAGNQLGRVSAVSGRQVVRLRDKHQI